MAVSDSQISDVLKRLEGFTSAVDTPLTAKGQLDVPALERMIERVIDAGAKGVLALGWMGQGPLLPDNVKADVMRETVRIAAGRVLVVASVAEQSLPRVLQQAQMAKEVGVDILLSTPPYSYHVGSDQIYAFFRDLAAETDMPVIIYHNTEIGVQPDLPLMIKLSQTPGMIGVKSFSNFNLLQQYFYRAARPGRFAVFSASMYHLAATLLLGFRHFMVGTPGNLTPSLCAQLFRDAQAGNWEAVSKNYNRMVKLFNVLALDTAAGDVTVKFILSELGLCKPYVISPLKEPSAEDKAVARKAMKEFADILK